ncbi:MAG TPA: metallophosphoesterase [Pyrinomonadaceae bacterium]|jgi:hypothetical protein|nr:metallophosphoesterase [Pyrinomonadaceae bacterium]
MHTLTGNRDQVLQLMDNTIQHLQTNQQASAASIGGETDVLTTLNLGLMEAQAGGGTAAAASLNFADQQNEDWYVPRNQAVAVFQAAMDEYLEQKNAPEAPPQGGGASAASVGEGALSHEEIAANVFYNGESPGSAGAGAMAAAIIEQFSNLDPGWASWVLVKAKAWLTGKHAFTSHQSLTDFRFDMNDEATIAVVGDWGGGNAAAQAVAKQIKQINPDHVIHLGDVYYAGTPKETKERFLQYWPTPTDPGKSFALNSNHEMYGGGYGYFDITLPTFKQPASYFSLSNNHWRLIGLDTGYDEHELHDPQAEWLAAQLADDGKKNILFSHHQPFSAYETEDCSKLLSKMKPFMDSGKIDGWIWGHEHLCVTYQPYMGIKGVCLGNGCFPYNPPTIQPRAPVEWLNNRAQPDDNDFKGVHTFALLTINPDQIEIKYIDQDGFVGHTQTWT